MRKHITAKIVIYLLVILLQAFSWNMKGFGQYQKRDSLLDVLKNATQDSVRCRIMLNIGGYYERREPDSALLWYDKVYSLASKELDEGEIFTVYSA